MYSEDPVERLHQKVFVRICKDSKYEMEYIEAVQFAAKVLDVHPLLLASSIGFDNMERISKGKHPICEYERNILYNN